MFAIIKRPCAGTPLSHGGGGGYGILQTIIVRNQVAELQAANEAATRRKSHKRKRIQRERTLKVIEGVRLTTLKEFNARSDGKRASKRSRVETGTQSLRHCGTCGEAGHNARTCKNDAQGTVE